MVNRFSERFQLVLPYLGLVLLPAVALLFALLLPGQPVWEYPPLHSFLETFGAFVALSTAAIMLGLPAQSDSEHVPFGVIAGLVAMGLLDGVHAAVDVQDSFVALHSITTLLGGLLFVTALDPRLWITARQRRALLWAVVLLAAVLVLLSLVFAKYWPWLSALGEFGASAVMLNAVGGVAFLIAALRLQSLSIRFDSLNLRLFAYLSVLFAAAGMVFQLSIIWDSVWWWWHGLRFVGYLLALGVVVMHLKQSFTAMQVYRERLEVAAGAGGIGIWDLDLRSQRLDCDERMYKLYHLEDEKVDASFEAWAQFLHHEDLEVAKAAMHRAISENIDLDCEFRITPPAGGIYHIKTHGKIIHDSSGKPVRLVGTNWDITDTKSLQEEIKNLALTDALTGLANRNLLEDRLAQGIAHSDRSEEILTVCMLDLDGFKPVNDTLGHAAGDKLLIEIARRLEEALRPEDTVLRLGGDEFVLIVGGSHSELEAETIVQRVLNVVAQPCQISGETVRVTASIGVTFYPRDKVDGSLLLRHADQAMYRAKAAGKNKFSLFDPMLESRQKENFRTVKRIERALQSDQFELYYQPQVDCVSGKVVSVEALIRWNHPVLGQVSPGEFLPLVEHDDIIIRIGEWVIETAAEQAWQWQQQGLDVSVGVNIASRHLLQGDLGQVLDRVEQKYNSHLLSKLEFEFVETAALEDLKAISKLNAELQQRGVRVALDDFGTGFSSLTHLKHLSVNTLKIDRSFIRDMQSDPGDLAIIEGVIGLSRGFNCRVIGEGAESVEQVLILLGAGCSVIQGYALCRPLPAEACTEWMRKFSLNPLWNAVKTAFPSRMDFDLLMFDVIHRNWIKQVRDYCDYCDIGHSVLPPDSHDTCRMTRWFASEQFHGKPPEVMQQLKYQHQVVHSQGDELVEMVKAGADSEAIQRKSDQVEAASKTFYDMAAAIRSN